MFGYPITNTLMGLGGYPASDRQYLGMPGMHGTYEANMAMQYRRADRDRRPLRRPRDRRPGHFASEPRKIIHIDIDPVDFQAGEGRRADRRQHCRRARRNDQAARSQSDARPEPEALAWWWNQVEEWRRRDRMKFRNSDEIIKPQYVVQKLWEVTDGDAFITSDVGQHQMWAAQYYRFDKPRRWLNSGGLGTMGVGLPHAMGAQLAHPAARSLRDRGGLDPDEHPGTVHLLSVQAADQDLQPNNRYLGMVRQWQRCSMAAAIPSPTWTRCPIRQAGRIPRTRRPAGGQAGRRRGALREGLQPQRTIWCSSTSRSTRPKTCIRWSRVGRVSPDDPLRRSL